MRFIAVFQQLHSTYGIGFESRIEASDFLFWGYEDKELTPCGIYDVLTGRTTLYDHFGRQTAPVSIEEISRFAVAHLNRIRQYVDVYY